MSNKYALVLNSGSSSIKFQVLDPNADSTQEPFVSGLVERIGEKSGHIKIQTETTKMEDTRPILSHSVGLERAFGMMTLLGVGPQDLDLCAVGHRVVHGGDEFHAPELIEGDVLDRLRALIPLAPLHNPANIDGIENAQALLPDVPHVAVFDTSFFSTMPERASNYALNFEVARKYHIKRYGFHGTSHEYVSRQVPDLLGKPAEEVNQITLHLGNGASAAAIRGGKAEDTTMGLTPLAGLVMGTRTGDIDPGIIFHLERSANMKVDEIDNLLNRQSGLKGMAGVNDFRELQELIDEGNEDAKLAYDVYIHALRRFIGAYIFNLGGVDAITFTAGVGENAVGVRRDALADLEAFGIEIDDQRNQNEEGIEGPRLISSDSSKVKVFVVPTNEELAIARYAYELAGHK
ncbi:acetate kinase [Corynebacterium anserum]|uniref:Acetate kinase n=1 Tax=Corynebacterium anserum TaxID=2684406 RepID=A0A7G7YLY6_9CORY|nr:acetate kinase [Corynebacterium anserum]MBC2681327.1 acetate/propionate family kinase [Corynebacterium anserum]QNH95506.1 acetate/propionate family kinase [Corynebacterium anserum]